MIANHLNSVFVETTTSGDSVRTSTLHSEHEDLSKTLKKSKKVALFEAADTNGTLNNIREKNRRYKKQKSKDAYKRAESDSIELDAGDTSADQPLHEAYAVLSSGFND
jgi:hypothetical protein